MPTTKIIRAGVSLALLASLAACAEDTILSPTFGAGCNVGSIAPGQMKTGTFTDSSCTVPYHFWSEDLHPYESYTVNLTKGKAYLFYEAQVPDPAQDSINDVDALLTLWGTNSDGAIVPLAISDDDGEGIDGHDAQIWFIAPSSGSYQLVAGAYGATDRGGYRLEAHECPVLATLDTSGTYTLTLNSTSACIRIAPGGVQADTSRISMIAIPFEPGDSLIVLVDSAGFVPNYEFFGPGFDTYENIYDFTEADADKGLDIYTTLAMNEVGGVATLAIGGDVLTASGDFKLQLVVDHQAAPPAGATPWSMGRISLGSRKPPALKSR